VACPDYPSSCRAPNSTQSHLTKEEQAEVTGKAASLASEAERCDYCGLVFVRGLSTRRLGWLSSMLGAGFHPAQGYS
jgi:hypothetical protein